MQHALSARGRRALEAALRNSPLLAFDFDGTLAAIVDDPDAARVDAEVSATLARLARRLPVAIVTGRSVGDVSRRLGFEPAWIIGSHGAEDPQRALPQGSIALLEPLRERLGGWAASPQGAGIQVEDKGHSLALHYRRAPDHLRARRALQELLGELPPGLRSFGGKCVLNVVPANAPDKGDAVVSLMARAGARSVVYVGDDVNDEAVFQRARRGWFTVRVGRDDAGSAARFALEDHTQVIELLRAIEAMAAG